MHLQSYSICIFQLCVCPLSLRVWGLHDCLCHKQYKDHTKRVPACLCEGMWVFTLKTTFRCALCSAVVTWKPKLAFKQDSYLLSSIYSAARQRENCFWCHCFLIWFLYNLSLFLYNSHSPQMFVIIIVIFYKYKYLY